jgi:hypothetical protein
MIAGSPVYVTFAGIGLQRRVAFLFASDGAIWKHWYIFCYSDPRTYGSLCTGDPGNWAGAGDTSFAAPIVAGIQALINQKMGGKQGLPTSYIIN